MIEIDSAKLILSLVDTETGEIITREATLGDFKEVTKKASTSKAKKPKDTDPVPKIELLDNKLQLNAAAVELTGFEPDNKYDVRFEKKGRQITPIIVWDENKGNRLTKTYTISFRGSRNENLAVYGTVFELVPYEGHDGWFKLIGNAPEKEDDIIDVPEEIANPEDEEDLDGLDESNENISFDLDI